MWDARFLEGLVSVMRNIHRAFLCLDDANFLPQLNEAGRVIRVKCETMHSAHLARVARTLDDELLGGRHLALARGWPAEMSHAVLGRPGSAIRLFWVRAMLRCRRIDVPQVVYKHHFDHQPTFCVVFRARPF